MNNKITSKTDRDNRSLTTALLKGALIWAPAYSVGTSALAYWLTPLLSSNAPVFSSILPHAIALYLPWGIIAGAAKWMLLNHRSPDGIIRRRTGRKRNGRLSRGSRTRLRPKHA